MIKDRAVSLLKMLAKRQDLALAALLIMIVFMMIIPLPTLLVDVLIGFNISIAIVLLMVGIYLPSPLEFSSFPSVLLTTTLFRLALSITTTRLILLQADAGHIVETFGNFVVAGNLVVGIVIFLIITVVQFVVVTKGSERVAEVSARFSLDAMPGKQMSIDGDMRAGAIDADEARTRRTLIEKESQLYGSMDGAMKFVKGDAIAGLIIIGVNIIGGITIGMMNKGMTAGEALHVYSILTVGDGLVSQIPGLLIAMTAGIIVTRVDSGEKKNLGEDMTKQVGADPRAFLIGGAICVGFAAIPGMPYMVFIALGSAFASIGGFRLYKSRIAAKNKDRKKFKGTRSSVESSRENEGDEFAITMPLILDLPESMQVDLDENSLNDELSSLRRALYLDLGVPFPGVHLRFSPDIPEQTYAILLQEVPVAKGQLPRNKILLRETQSNLEMLNIPYSETDEFLPRIDSIWTEKGSLDLVEKSGINYMTGTQIITYHLSLILKKYAKDFVGLQETKFLLDQMEGKFGELVKEVQRNLSVQKISEIFQRLVVEEVSIRNMRSILEVLIEWGQKEKDVILLVEYVRNSLGRQISFQHANQQNILSTFLLTPEAEDQIRSAIRQTSSGSYLALEPEVSQGLISNISEAVGDLKKYLSMPVILVSMDIRRYLRKLVESEFPEIYVLSHQELSDDVTVQPLSKIDSS